ncbi:MAG TPA: hypothetical protein VIK86_08045 [Candidatus Paceibacterota bacterium]
MKFLYVLDKEVADSLIQKGMKNISITTIEGKTAYVFENSKDVFIGQYAKNQILLTNKLFF